MSKKVVLVVPEAPPVQAAIAGAQRKLAASGLRVGVLDNSKGNADHLLRFVVAGLRASLPVRSIVELRKDNVSLPAPGGVLDRLTREADVVVSAMAD